MSFSEKGWILEHWYIVYFPETFADLVMVTNVTKIEEKLAPPDLCKQKNKSGKPDFKNLAVNFE